MEAISSAPQARCNGRSAVMILAFVVAVLASPVFVFLVRANAS
jgi:hypothetical protein